MIRVSIRPNKHSFKHSNSEFSRQVGDQYADKPAVGRIKDSIMQEVLRRMGPRAELIEGRWIRWASRSIILAVDAEAIDPLRTGRVLIQVRDRAKGIGSAVPMQPSERSHRVCDFEGISSYPAVRENGVLPQAWAVGKSNPEV